MIRTGVTTKKGKFGQKQAQKMTGRFPCSGFVANASWYTRYGMQRIGLTTTGGIEKRLF